MPFFFHSKTGFLCGALTVPETYFEGHGGLCCALPCPAQIFAFFFLQRSPSSFPSPLFLLFLLFLSSIVRRTCHVVSEGFQLGDFSTSAPQVLDDSTFCYFYFQETRVLMSSFSDLWSENTFFLCLWLPFFLFAVCVFNRNLCFGVVYKSWVLFSVQLRICFESLSFFFLFNSSKMDVQWFQHAFKSQQEHIVLSLSTFRYSLGGPTASF